MSVTTVLGLPRLGSHRALVLALAVDALGSGLSGPLLLVYLTRVAGLGVAAAGVLLGAGAVVALAVPAVVARVARHTSAKRIVIVAQLVQAVGVGCLLVSGVPVLLAIGAALVAVGQRTFWSSVFSVIADVADGAEPADQSRWFAVPSMMQYAGVAIGALVAGALLAIPAGWPLTVALVANGVSFVFSAIVLLLERAHVQAAPVEQVGAPLWRDRRYLALILGNTLLVVPSMMLGIGLPLYVTTTLHAPGWIIGPLLALVTVIAATCQGWGIRLLRRRERATAMVLAGGCWAVWGIGTAAVDLLHGTVVIAGLFVFVLIYAAAEVLHAPASMEVASSLAPASARPAYLSWFQFSFAIAAIVSPTVFGITSAAWAPLPWLIAAGSAVVGALVIAGIAKSVRRERLSPPTLATAPSTRP